MSCVQFYSQIIKKYTPENKTMGHSNIGVTYDHQPLIRKEYSQFINKQHKTTNEVILFKFILSEIKYNSKRCNKQTLTNLIFGQITCTKNRTIFNEN